MWLLARLRDSLDVFSETSNRTDSSFNLEIKQNKTILGLHRLVYFVFFFCESTGLSWLLVSFQQRRISPVKVIDVSEGFHRMYPTWLLILARWVRAWLSTKRCPLWRLRGCLQKNHISSVHILYPQCKRIRLLSNINTEPGKHCTASSLITMQLMCYFLPMWDYFHLSH